MKARQLYVEFQGDPKCKVENYKRYCGEEKFAPLSPSDEVIRFVEYSAYEDLLKQIEVFKNHKVLSREELEGAFTNLFGGEGFK